MRSKTVLILILLLAPVFSTAFAGHGYSQGCVKPCCSHEKDSLAEKFFDKYDFFMKHKDEIALTDQQQKTLQDIKFNIKRRVIEAEARKDTAKIDLWQELYQDRPDIGKIDNAINAKASAKSEIWKAYASGLVDMKVVLNEEQLAAVKKIGWEEKYSG